MKARAQSADEPGDGNVVPMALPAENGKRAPIYPEWSSASGDASDSFDSDVARRGASLAQWLVLFAVLGGLIGGAKWYVGATPADAGAPAPGKIVITGRAMAATAEAVPGTIAAEAGTDPQAAAIADPTADRLPAASSGANGATAANDPRIESLPPGTAATTVAGTTNGAGAGTPARPARTVRTPGDVPYPRRLHDVQPIIPDDAAVQRGVAVLSLLIDASGNVVEIDVLRGIDAYVDRSVIAAVRQWKFAPSARNGEPVAVRGNFTVKLGY
ncbi:MAG TPA: TonB family protein [Acidobacteriota bacterium]